MNTYFIKHLKVFFSVAIVVLLVACEKNEDLNTSDVSGTYVGTLTTNSTSRLNSSAAIIPATVVVKNIGNKIEVHCFAEDFDATIMLDMYANEDQVMVCLTGDDFENMYGHKLGQGMMGNNMQGTAWMQHLNNEHQEGDEHFGGFNIHDHTFNFTFRMSNGDFYFQGLKKLN